MNPSILMFSYLMRIHANSIANLKLFCRPDLWAIILGSCGRADSIPISRVYCYFSLRRMGKHSVPIFTRRVNEKIVDTLKVDRVKQKVGDFIM